MLKLYSIRESLSVLLLKLISSSFIYYLPHPTLCNKSSLNLQDSHVVETALTS